MLFQDINQQSNKILEDTQIISEKGKLTNLKSTVADMAKDTIDDMFDSIMKDGKISADERKKIKKAQEAGYSLLDIERSSLANAISGEKIRSLSDYKNKSGEKNSKNNIGKGNSNVSTKNEKITLTVKDQVRLEKNIFSQDDKTKRTIFKSLMTLYNNLVDNKKIKTEAFDLLLNDRKLLSDQELIKILDYIYNVQRRNKEKVKESIILEDAIKKIKNTVVSKEWKKRGSRRDKDNLVKLMRFFKLNDMQIFTAFNKTSKNLTYDEIKRLNIDIKHSNMPVTKQDLEKLSHTLGKFKLNQFLIKLKNSIKS